MLHQLCPGSVQGGQGGEDDATVGSGMTDVGSDCQQQPGGLDEEELAEALEVKLSKGSTKEDCVL